MDRLLALRWSQRVFSWAHHDNSPQAWDNWSCMSHTHIRGNITFVVCVRLQTAPEIPFYGQGLCVCKCVYKYSDCACVCVRASVYFVGISHVLQEVSVLSANVCLCIHPLQPWLIPAITGSGAGVNRLPPDHLMVCGTPAPVGTHSLWGETVMKHSPPNYCQHIAHAVSVLLLP